MIFLLRHATIIASAACICFCIVAVGLQLERIERKQTSCMPSNTIAMSMDNSLLTQEGIKTMREKQGTVTIPNPPPHKPIQIAVAGR